MPELQVQSDAESDRPRRGGRNTGTPLGARSAAFARRLGSRRALAHAARFLLAFSPAILLGLLIEIYGVNVPTWDDWERGPLIGAWHAGTLSWDYLYSPHISHRILFPRLIILGLNEASDGDLRAEMGMIWLITTLAGIGVFVLLRRTFGRDDRIVYPAAFLANLLIFSPLQWQNFLWAIQIAFVLPMTCAIWMIVALGSRWRAWAKFAACLALAVLGAHSFGHGLLLWPLGLLFALLSPQLGNWKMRGLWAAAWAACAAAAALAYFNPETFVSTSHAVHNYQVPRGERPPGLQSLDATLADTGRLAIFFSRMLGSQFARTFSADPLVVGEAVGAALAAVMAAAGIWWAVRWRDPQLREKALPWLALGGAGVGAALMVTVARAGVAGLYRALSPRYIGMTLYVGLSALVLIALFAWIAWRRGRDDGSPRVRWIPGAALVVAGAFAALQFGFWQFGIHKMEIHQAARLHARTNLTFINFFRPDRLERLDGSYQFVREQANTLNQLGFLKPPLAESTRLEDTFKRSSKPLTKSRAMFEELSVDAFADPPALVARGYAKLPGDADRPADGVLIVVRHDDGSREIIGIADIHSPPEIHFYAHDHEFDGIREFDDHPFSRWEKLIPLNDLTAPCTIEAWAVNSDEMKAYRIQGAYRIDPKSGSVTTDPD